MHAWIWEENIIPSRRAPTRKRRYSMTLSSTSSTAVASSGVSDGGGSREQAEARAAVLASLQSAGSTYDSQLQRRAADLHANSAAISKQEDELRKQTAALAKESVKWEKEVGKATRAVNEVGDVQNWAEMIERDLLVVEETLRLAEGGEDPSSASGVNTWWR